MYGSKFQLASLSHFELLIDTYLKSLFFRVFAPLVLSLKVMQRNKSYQLEGYRDIIESARNKDSTR